MRFIFAFLLVAHAGAHLPGFLVAWRLQDLAELPYRTTIFGTAADIGTVGMRLVGVAWLLSAVALVVVAAGVAMRAGPWREALPVVLAVSTLLSAIGWPEARLGLVANAVIAALLLAGMRAGVFGPGP